jgi:Dihydrodipicolinate synthetase family
MPPNKTWLREHAAMSIFGRHVSKLAGFAAAAPTPFDENGSVDSATLERFCDRQISDGANALVVCGITGEGPLSVGLNMRRSFELRSMPRVAVYR